MIRDQYKRDLLSVREGNPGWGSSAERNAGCEVIRFLNKRKNIRSVLDFGAGNGTLGKYVVRMQKAGMMRKDLRWRDYDPGMPGIDKLPVEQFDCIITTDLLEHIEPDDLDETLGWMCDHATMTQFHFIDCNDNAQLLPDGRSVHLIVESPDWWLAKLKERRWTVMQYTQSMKLKRSRQRYDCLIILDRA